MDLIKFINYLASIKKNALEAQGSGMDKLGGFSLSRNASTFMALAQTGMSLQQEKQQREQAQQQMQQMQQMNGQR